jgi:hypothetical protein
MLPPAEHDKSLDWPVNSRIAWLALGPIDVPSLSWRLALHFLPCHQIADLRLRLAGNQGRIQGLKLVCGRADATAAEAYRVWSATPDLQARLDLSARRRSPKRDRPPVP